MSTTAEKTTPPKPSEEHFQEVMDELEKIKKEVVSTKGWFERNSDRPRILFRLVGSLVIILSISVPLLGVLDGVWNTVVLPVVAIAIAGLTSLNAFFQWQSQWQGNRQTQFALEHLLTKWELEIVEAKFHPDQEKAIKMAIEATSRLLDQAREITSSSTGDYFKSIQLPTTK